MGIRVIKTAIAAVAAIYIAQYFGLKYELSAGLLAVLGVDVTRRRSLRSASARIAASVLGLLIAVVLFYLFGFHVWELAVFIIIMYPLLAKVNLKDGIITSTVMVIHVFTLGKLDSAAIVNEISLLLIGFGCATAINFVYMPKVDNQIVETRLRVEELFSEIFTKIGSHLTDHAYIWDGSELIKAEEAIQEGFMLSEQMQENMLFSREEEWHTYFQMRRQQMESIHRMTGLVSQVYQTLPHGEITAEMFKDLSRDVKNEFYTGTVDKQVTEMSKRFKTMPLPATREEFEVRSALLQLVTELKIYLSIAEKLKKKGQT